MSLRTTWEGYMVFVRFDRLLIQMLPVQHFLLIGGLSWLFSKNKRHFENIFRSNKSLPHQFSVLIFYPIADGTKVSVTAGNEENSLADIKNNTTEVQSQIAKFSDLRFVGKSGRGKNFNLTITIHTKPMKEVTIVTNVIKVTVDGPRDSRNPNNKIMGKRSFDNWYTLSIV